MSDGITDMRDEEIKDLQTALKGHEKIIMDYPFLKKKLELIEKEFEYGLPTSMKECAFICLKIYDILENKK